MGDRHTVNSAFVHPLKTQIRKKTAAAEASVGVAKGELVMARQLVNPLGVEETSAGYLMEWYVKLIGSGVMIDLKVCFSEI